MASASSYAAERHRMVSEQIAARGIRDARVLTALERVPRHCFVPVAQRDHAYADSPLPIGHRQTISQPYMVALMTEVLQVRARDRVLEVGTGSGYQAAVLADLGAEVYSIERHAELSLAATENLRAVGCDTHVHLRVGDGEQGWPEAAPFTAIVVTAAARRIPRSLLPQLAPDGCLVVPVGEAELQGLVRIRHGASGWQEDYFGECRFVRLVGSDGWDES